MPSTLIRNGHVLDLNRPFEQADIFIEGDEIRQVGPGLSSSADRVIDAAGRVVMPGLISGHTHGTQILDRGMADNQPLDLWLLYAVGGPPRDARESYVLSAWNALVQLKTGCTGSLDHAMVPLGDFEATSDAIMQAYVDTGARVAVAASVGDIDLFQTMPVHLLPGRPVPSMGRGPVVAADVLKAARKFLDKWQGKVSRVQPYLGPSAPQRCSDELLLGSFDLAKEFNAGVHTHLLEARSQWFACQQRFGGSPLAFLNRHSCLGGHLSCAHSIWLEPADMDLLAATGTCVSHNPVSNLRLASGVADVQGLLARGVNVGLGADGAASNDNQNMWEVLKLAAILHKGHGPKERWVTADKALSLCLEGGAKILRQPVGAIEPGHQADLVILGGQELFMRPKEHMIASLVFGELGQSVETVLVAGDVVIDGGQSTKINEASLKAEAAAIVEKIGATLGEREAFYQERRGYVEDLLEAVERQAAGPRRQMAFPS